MRRRVEADAQAVLLQNARKGRRGRAFAVGSGNMDAAEPLVRVAQTAKQLFGAVQPKLDAVLLKTVEVVERLLIGGGSGASHSHLS